MVSSRGPASSPVATASRMRACSYAKPPRETAGDAVGELAGGLAAAVGAMPGVGVGVPQAGHDGAVRGIDAAEGGGAPGAVGFDRRDASAAYDDVGVVAGRLARAVPQAPGVHHQVGGCGSGGGEGDADGTGRAAVDADEPQPGAGQVQQGGGVAGPGGVVGRFGGEGAQVAARGAVGVDGQQAQRRLDDHRHPAAVGRPDGPGVVPVGDRRVRRDGVQAVGSGGGVDDPDEVVALPEAGVEAVAVAEGEVAAVGRPARTAGQPAAAEGCGQDAFLAGRQVADEQSSGQVETGQPLSVGGQRGVDPAAGGERGLLTGGQIVAVHAEESVAVVGVDEGALVRRPGGREEIAGAGRPVQSPGRTAARTAGEPQGVEGGERDLPAVGRQRGQVDAARGAGVGRLPEVVLLGLVPRPPHGEHALEGQGLRLPGTVRAYEGEGAVEGEEQLSRRRPARGHRGDVAGHRDGPAVDDQGAGGVRWGGGAQMCQAAVGGDGGGHDLRARGLGVPCGDRAGAVGGHGGDGTGVQAGAQRGGDGLRADEQDAGAVR